MLESRGTSLWCLVAIAAAAVLAAPASPAAVLRAQAPAADTMAFYKALDLEAAGKYRDAAPLFRTAVHTSAAVNALLGLERVYAELGWSDSLVALVDTLVTQNPREETYRTVQLRTFQSLGREADLRRAFERWTHDVPNSPSPYRDYARLLLQRNQTAAADSVLARAKQSLGTTRDLSLELAQTRAAQGQWVKSAQAWRVALASADYLEQAAAYALAPTPSPVRDSIRDTFLAPPIEVGARRALADLESTWGSPADGWDALKDLPPDSAAAAAWSDFAQRAESEERWSIAREALESALRWRKTPELSVRAATAALNAGDPIAAVRLAPPLQGDSATVAHQYLALHVRALAALARPSEAERLLAAYDRFLNPAEHNSLTRTVAWGWVRTGDMARARVALAGTGAEGDSSDAAGWLALYDGNLKTARALLRGGSESTPELAAALGLIARLKADTAPEIGHAFLALARGDSAGAAAQFTAAAEHTPQVRSVLLLMAARLQAATGHGPQAIALWQRIVQADSASPEAPQAELAWARALRASGNSVEARKHLEHMILSYPDSALLPQARRELELVRGSVPPSP
ncbi:MAG TPA: hypothetical protein VHB25_08795 [Gemmatimonadaceae bacterium]|nr:hypothetical protein [Gemmatimonadaceae bacterium]